MQALVLKDNYSRAFSLYRQVNAVAAKLLSTSEYINSQRQIRQIVFYLPVTHLAALTV